MKKYSLFIFDWQGTLMDEKNGGLFEGTFELLTYLKNNNIKIAIATGANRVLLDGLLDILKLKNYFDYVKTSSECLPKPDPQMLKQILAQSGVSKEEAIMIGDTPVDIQMAKMAGVDSIALHQNSYLYPVLMIEQPTYMFNDIRELYKFTTQVE